MMKKYSMIIVFLSYAFIFSGCASINQGLTPSAKTVASDFDDTIEVIQDSVSAASSLSEGWHTLGFRWSSKAPDIVFIKVGTKGIVNISAVAFNIDGNIIRIDKPASTLTDYGDWSTRQFSMSLEQFRQMAAAQTVKMKVVMIDKYSISSFGQSNPSAIVGGKFAPFLQQVDAQLAKLKM